MENNKTSQFAKVFFKMLDLLIPEFSENPLDDFANGNVAVCLINDDGNVCGKFGATIKYVGDNFSKMPGSRHVRKVGREDKRKVYRSI